MGTCVRSKNSLLELVLSFHHEDARDQIRVIRLGSKRRYPRAMPLAPTLEIFVVFGPNPVSIPWERDELAFSLFEFSVCNSLSLTNSWLFISEHGALCVLNKCSTTKSHSQPFPGIICTYASHCWPASQAFFLRVCIYVCVRCIRAPLSRGHTSASGAFFDPCSRYFVVAYFLR